MPPKKPLPRRKLPAPPGGTKRFGAATEQALQEYGSQYAPEELTAKRITRLMPMPMLPSRGNAAGGVDIRANETRMPLPPETLEAYQLDRAMGGRFAPQFRSAPTPVNMAWEWKLPPANQPPPTEPMPTQPQMGAMSQDAQTWAALQSLQRRRQMYPKTFVPARQIMGR